MVHTTRTKEEQACSRSLTLRARPRSYTQSGAASVSHSERNRVGLALGAYSRRVPATVSYLARDRIRLIRIADIAEAFLVWLDPKLLSMER
eukprot:7818665-Pyramimonas_sp.AAC.1